VSNGALVVVDTMVVSALVNERRDPATATEYRKLIDGRAVVISFVTVTEMRYGTLKANWGEFRRRELERTLSGLVAVQPDDDLMTRCAELRDRCEAVTAVDPARAARSPFEALGPARTACRSGARRP
jgi:predicted nucleic acid-binding protein